jgi:hypothetical protein
MRRRATIYYAGISSRTEGQDASDKGTRDPDASWTSIARACPSVRQDSPVFALFSSVITSCLLVSRKRVRRDKRGGTPKALGQSPS